MKARRLALALGLVLLAATTLRAQPAADPAAPGAFKLSKKAARIAADGGKTTLDVLRPEGVKGPLPTVVIVPGLGCKPESYGKLSSWLVSHGFAVALFESSGNASYDARAWDAALSRAMDRLQKEDEDPASELFHAVDFSRLGIVGHSLGGAVATLAAARDHRFKALATFGAAAVDRTFLDDARSVEAATIVIDGGLDRIAPPDEFGAVIVDRVRNDHKARLVVKGGNHLNAPADFDVDYVQDTPRVVLKPNPLFFFMPTPTLDVPVVAGVKPIDGEAHRALAFPYLTAWMETYVAGVKDTFGYVDGTKAAAAKAKGLLDVAEFRDGARSAAGKPAAIGRGSFRAARPSSEGLIRALDRANDPDRDRAR